MNWSAWIIPAVIFIMGSTACGGAQRAVTPSAILSKSSGAGAIGSAWETLPPLPQDKSPASTNFTLVQDGNDWSSRDTFGYTTDSGTSQSFAPPNGKLAWAIYSFYCGSHIAKGISVTPQPSGHGVYVGYSDYSAHNWKFLGPFTVPALPDPAADINIPLSQPTLSPMGYIYVAIAVFGSPANALIDQVGLSVSNWADGQMNLAAQKVTWFSLAEIADRPAIAYVEDGGTLKFLRASVPDGSQWDSPVAVAEGFYSGGWSVSLAEIAGRPAIAAYRTNVGGSLRFVRALDASGSSWPAQPQTVITSDADFYCGFYPSLAALNDYTAIAFRGVGNKLSYAVNNADASSSWFTMTLDGVNQSSSNCVLRLVNGHPAICYIAKGLGFNPPDYLNFAYSSSPSGINLQDWTIVTVEETFNSFGSGWVCFTQLSNSIPAVFYKDQNGAGYRYAYAKSATGLDGWVSKSIDLPADCFGVGIVLDNGFPALFYRGALGTSLMRALDTTGTSWASPIIFAPLSTGTTSIALIHDQPVMAYTANSDPNILAYTYRY